MSFAEWKEAVKKELMEAGLFKDYANERTESARGMYYSKDNYTHPESVAVSLVRTCKTGLTTEYEFKQYCRKHKIRRAWI